MDVAQKLINVGQLQYFLVSNNENELKLIVQFILQRQIVVVI